MNSEITTMEEFKYWVTVELAIQKKSQRDLAKNMNIAYPRISEAINGRASGKKYIVPLIEILGGDKKKFRQLLES